jgi:hypothetical protein
MRRDFLMLTVALMAVGCGTKSATTFSAAEVQAPPVSAATAETAQDEYERNYVKQSEERNRAKDEAMQQQFRLLPAAEQTAIAEVREAMQKRPAVDLTEAQHELMEKSPHFKVSDGMAYAIAIANREGIGELAQQLRLSQLDTLTLKMRIGSERRKDHRDEHIRVIKKAIATGMNSLTDADRRWLSARRVGPYLKNVKD